MGNPNIPDVTTPGDQLLASGVLEEKCGTCGGRGAVKGPDLQVYRYDCPDCNGTGYRFWQLLKKCEGEIITMPCGRKPPCDCPKCNDGNLEKATRGHTRKCCQGTGFVPVSEDTALRVLLEWCRDQCYLVTFDYRSEQGEIEIMEGSRATTVALDSLVDRSPLEALAAAIKASVEANHDPQETSQLPRGDDG